MATTSTFPQLNHSIEFQGKGGGGGGGGRYQEGEERGVAESSATEEYFRVMANHQPALRPMIGGRRIPNSTAKQQSIHGSRTSKMPPRHTSMNRLIR